MIPLIRSLFEHMAWADSALLDNVREHAGAFDDEQLRKWLHHIVMVQRFFLSLFQGREFDMQRERQVPGSIEEMDARFRESHDDALQFAAKVQESELSRTYELPRMPQFRPTLRDLMVQVAMHSEHHRAQVAARLRELGGKPAVTDYIMWVRKQSEVPAVPQN